MTKRQPAGTPIGGQFAQDRKPDGGDLIDSNYTPEALAKFESIWNGESEGYSEFVLKSDLAYYERLQRDIESERIDPTAVVGGGFVDSVDKRKIAERWLDERLSETIRAIATRGRSNRINQMNVINTMLASVSEPQIERLFPSSQ